MSRRTKELFYVSNSFYGSRAANAIQSLNTFIALSSHFDEAYYYCRGEKSGVQTEQSIQVLYGRRGRLGTLIYVALTTMQVLYLSRRVGKGSSLFFARNIYVAMFLCVFSQNKTVVELHSRPTKYQLRAIKYCAKKANFHITCITDNLRQHLLDADRVSGAANEIVVVPDAHPFDEAELARASEARSASARRTKPRIGYFGSLNRYKGSELIFDLCRRYPDNLSIYSKDQHLVPQDVLRNYRGYLKPDKIFDTLLSYDIALLFLVKTGESDDVSDFTSPLKLFEYIAAGLVVIATDHPVLKEVVDESHVLFVKNSISDVEAALTRLEKNSSEIARYAGAAISRGKEFTYVNRARNLLTKISPIEPEQ